MTASLLARIAAASLVLLIALCLAAELWLAPLRPGGSWLALKALPLLAPLFGVLHARRYTFQWSPMLLLAYFAEGVVRAATESGVPRWIASVEMLLSLTFSIAAVLFVRATRAA
jgi:uncharacterized membrane protein